MNVNINSCRERGWRARELEAVREEEREREM